MPSVRKSKVVPYSASQMFELVDDIESYPRFLPWCRSSDVHMRNGDQVRASIEIAKGKLQRTFTTLNRLQRNKMIEVRLVEGPFRHLEGFWQFHTLADGSCRVSLDMDFEFSNPIVRVAVGPVFTQIANTLVDAFCRRADDVYR